MWFIMDGRTAHLSSEPIKWPRPTTPRALAHKYPGSSRLERPREQISSAWIYPSVKTPNGSLPRELRVVDRSIDRSIIQSIKLSKYAECKYASQSSGGPYIRSIRLSVKSEIVRGCARSHEMWPQVSGLQPLPCGRPAALSISPDRRLSEKPAT